MPDSTDNTLSLLSQVHSISAEYLKLQLEQQGLPDLVSSHGFILFLLSRHEQLSMKEIAALINRDKSTTTVLVRKLEQYGFVQRIQNQDDKRIFNLELTEKGAEYTQKTALISSQLQETCFKGFSQKEKVQLYELLDRIKVNCESELQEN